MQSVLDLILGLAVLFFERWPPPWGVDCSRPLETGMVTKDSVVRQREQYLADTVRMWLGLKSTSMAQVPPLPDRLVRLFLRTEEIDCPHRDKCGAWEHSFSNNYWEGNLWEPEIDEWLAIERRTLVEQGEELVPLWPKGKRFAVCLSHDVDFLGCDVASHIVWRRLRLAKASGSLNTLSLAKEAMRGATRVAWNLLKKGIGRGAHSHSLAECLAIEDKLGVKATYFFTTYPYTGRKAPFDCVYKFSDTIAVRGRQRTIGTVSRMLRDEGHDVGLHGSYYSAIDPSILEGQKVKLEDVVGAPVTTTRQHWLHWDACVTPKLQADAGFLADSTVGFNRNIGFRAGTALPYYLYDTETGGALPTLEVPLIFQEGAVYSPSALGFNQALARRAFQVMVDRIGETGGCLTLLYHPDLKFTDPTVASTYQWMLETGLANNAWVTSLKEIEAWWRKRNETLFPVR